MLFLPEKCILFVCFSVSEEIGIVIFVFFYNLIWLICEDEMPSLISLCLRVARELGISFSQNAFSYTFIHRETWTE